jgi:hypothetical protein
MSTLTHWIASYLGWGMWAVRILIFGLLTIFRQQVCAGEWSSIIVAAARAAAGSGRTDGLLVTQRVVDMPGCTRYSLAVPTQQHDMTYEMGYKVNPVT